MKFQKIMIPLLLVFPMLFSGCGGKNDSPPETEAMVSVTETAPPEAVEKQFVPYEKNVKMLGRTTFKDGMLWLAQTDSGCEFRFRGKGASVTILGDNIAGDPEKDGKYARFAVYLNGERVLDELVTSPEKKYEIFSAAEESENVISVIKLSEASNSSFGIKEITAVTSGGIEPTPKNDLKIEFVGDSITCGYGVDDEVREHHFSTATEDGTKTYAYKTAQMLGADYSMVSYSGYGIISGYTGNGVKQPNQVVPKFYKRTAWTAGHYGDFFLSEDFWNFENFRSDVVVINLGTNDSSYCKGDPERCAEFRDAYAEFLKKVRELNPDAYILCTLGIMGSDLYPDIEEAITAYTKETGDTKVSAMLFDTQREEDGIAADWHPSEKTHEKAAERLSEEIRRILAE